MRRRVARLLRRLAQALDPQVTFIAPNYLGDKHELLRMVKSELARNDRRGGLQ